MTAPYDIAIIGGGIVGVATARAILLSRPSWRLVLLEAEDRLAAHQTGHNSGVIHSGLYYKPGSYKARLCVAGREALYQFCEEHEVPFERCGKIVAATCDEELPALAELESRARANGLAGLRRLGPDEAKEFEPHVRCVAALHVSETGVVDFTALTSSLADEVRALGGEVRLGAGLRAVKREPNAMVLETDNGEVHARSMVACAGLQSDRIARLCGVDPGVRIVPFRGEYYELAEARRDLVRGLIYPVPDPRFPFLGVHFTRTVDGRVEVGPNAVLATSRHGYLRRQVSPRDLANTLLFPGFWRLAGRYWRMGLGEVYRSLSKSAAVTAMQKLVPELRAEDIVPGKRGVRAQAMTKGGALADDFRFVDAERMVHVLNAPSPAATASLAIGEVIAARAVERLG